ncbi:MAG: acyl transferase [Chitinophagia bacterium]|nr:acyl transferase [Chitinophagia bacterium]
MTSKLFNNPETISLISPEILIQYAQTNFDGLALAIFAYQYSACAIYQRYCNLLSVTPNHVKHLSQIPFLPISFFKTHYVVSGTNINIAKPFESSGTTRSTTSKHYVADLTLYRHIALHGFSQFFGDMEQYAILALLPSYLERNNSSLVYMVNDWMNASGNAHNGFYLHNHQELNQKLSQLAATGVKTILIGVTFALLDFLEIFPQTHSQFTIIETGGMKGRKEEWTRQQVHQYIQAQCPNAYIRSEYGMTELLSQAYTSGNAYFKGISTLKCLVRDTNSPLDVAEQGAGALNIIDLANIHSCSFIATEDLGHVAQDGSFSVLGRIDHTDLRGCSLLTV